MPRRNGTGPMGAGSRTGRGLGVCKVSNAIKVGAGLGIGLGIGCQRGLGRRFNRNNPNQTASRSQKEILEEQKVILQNRVDEIEKQLEVL